MKNNLIIIAVVAALVGAGAGFFGGMKYQQNQQSSAAGQFAGRAGTNGGFARNGGANSTRNGFRPVAGSITSADDKSITVKMQDGSSKIVILSANTQINKAAVATKSDLAVGQVVAVFGTTNSDGSVTAQNIQLNPQQMRPQDNPRPTSAQ